ncbi:gag-pol polyprotein [Tanacetum coccineum]
MYIIYKNGGDEWIKAKMILGFADKMWKNACGWLILMEIKEEVAMDEELVALHQTQTWDLVPLPFGKRAINSRGVYKIKTKFHESIERYKALLVAKGYAQEYGMDY